MNNLFNLVQMEKFLYEKIKFLLPKIQHKKLLLAVSGGVDSMVLVHICLENKLDFAVAHCNFGLRGEDSEQDEIFVKNYCELYKIPFFSKKFDTKNLQNESQSSIQMLARALRYDFFKEIIGENNFDYLLTAHHQTDQIETILLNYVRGTGVKGLRGILPFSQKNQTVRLLFNFSKKEILEYANFYQLSWREDISNAQNKYLRNIIRNKILPILREINPSLERKSAENSEKMRAVSLIWHKYLKKIKKKICEKSENTLKINIPKLEKISNANVILAEILKKYDFDYAKSGEIWENKDTQTGKSFEGKTHIVRKDFLDFVIFPKNNFLKNDIIEVKDFQENEIIILNENQSFLVKKIKKEEGKEITFNFAKNIAYIDFQKLIFPLKIRPIQTGDYFYPINGKGKRKLKDFLTDLKIPFLEKKQIQLLCNANNEVIWIMNYRLDNRFKITENTSEIIYLQIENQAP